MANGKRKVNNAIISRVSAKRQKLPNGSTVVLYIQYYGGVVKRRVFSYLHKYKVLYWIPEEVFQHLIRDLLNKVLSRWMNDLPVGSLDIHSLRVEDNALVLPPVGSGPEDRDYGGRTRQCVVGILGETGSWKDRDDFLSRLSEAGLTMKQFNALYFHRLLQNRDQRAVLPVQFIDRLRHRSVSYNGVLQPWEKAYTDWECVNYKEYQNIDLQKACSVDPWALKVYKYNTYTDDPANRVKLARNIMIHLNDYRVRERKCLYTTYQLGALVDEIFPDLGSRLFEFLLEIGIDLDFLKSRNCFKISICYQILKDGGLEGYLKKISCWTEEGLLDWVNLHAKQQMVVKPPKEVAVCGDCEGNGVIGRFCVEIAMVLGSLGDS